MVNDFPIINTNRFLLRQFTDSDLENVFNGLSHPDVIKYYGIHFDSLGETRKQMTWFENLEKTGTGIWWAICSGDNQVFFGASGLNNLIKEHKKAEIGCWLLPPFWGQGIMLEVLSFILKYGFDTLGLHRIEGFVESDNHNCKRALAKLAFKHEGTMKDCELKNGRFISLDIYAKFNID